MPYLFVVNYKYYSRGSRSHFITAINYIVQCFFFAGTIRGRGGPFMAPLKVLGRTFHSAADVAVAMDDPVQLKGPTRCKDRDTNNFSDYIKLCCA